MATLWFAPKAQFAVMDASALDGDGGIASDDEIFDQMYFVSQATHDTTINLGKSTVAAADDVTEVGQSFTADGPYVGRVDVIAGKAATPTDNLTCAIYSDDGTDPETLLCTSKTKLAAGDLAVTPELESFEFDPADYTQALMPGEKYWIVFDRDGSASDTNYFKINYEDSASTVASHALTRSDDDMGTWTADASGDDLYHVIYAGGIPAKNVRISGGERDVDTQKLLGYNEVLDEKRATVIEATATLIYQGKYTQTLFSGAAQNVTGNYHRNTGGEKSSNDRTQKSCMFYLNDGTNVVAILLDDAMVTSREVSMDAEGHMEETISIKCLASNYYEEDDYAD